MGKKLRWKERQPRIRSQQTKICQNICCLHCWQMPTVLLVWKIWCRCLAWRGWLKQKTTQGQPLFVVGNNSILIDPSIENSLFLNYVFISTVLEIFIKCLYFFEWLSWIVWCFIVSYDLGISIQEFYIRFNLLSLQDQMVLI